MADAEVPFFGELDPTSGNLRKVAKVSPWLRLRSSGYDGAILLSSIDPLIDIETQQGGRPSEHIFTGAVMATRERAVAILAELSALFAANGVPHRIEAYAAPGSSQLIDQWNHAWPE